MRVLSFLFFVVWLLISSATLVAAADPDPEMLIEQQHYKQARRILEQRLSHNPKDLKATEPLAKIKLEGKQNDDVIKMMAPLLAQNPNNAEYHIILADAYGQKAGSESAGIFEKMRCGRTMKKRATLRLHSIRRTSTPSTE